MPTEHGVKYWLDHHEEYRFAPNDEWEVLWHWWMWAWHKGAESYHAIKARDARDKARLAR